VTHTTSREAALVLFRLLSTAYPRLRALAKWWGEILTLMELWYRSEGNQGIRRMKKAFEICVRRSLNEKADPLTFCKQDKDGVPDVMRPFMHFCMSGPMTEQKLCVILSLSRVTELFVGIPNEKDINAQLEIIASSQLSKKAESFSKELAKFIRSFLTSYPNHPVSLKWNSILKASNNLGTQFLVSRGPNGPLTENAHLDALSLDMNLELRNELIGLQKFVLDETLLGDEPDKLLTEPQRLDSIRDLSGCVNPCAGKLSVLPEKSGKLRIIAQPDYFTQATLSPIHDWLQKVCSSFTADYTMNQSGSVAVLKDWTSRNLFLASFDHSSCTDLMPVAVQEAVLTVRFGSEVSTRIRKVMVNRDFLLRLPSGSFRRVRWSVGQPMGLKASWPLMALTHHFLVQYAHWDVVGKKFPKRPFTQYCVLGDDVVIAHRNTAARYLKLVRSLGMKVNSLKSHTTGRGTNIDSLAEFAKVIVWKGKVIDTVKPNQVLAALNDWTQCLPLFRSLYLNSNLKFKLELLKRVIKMHWAGSANVLTTLLTIPPEFGGVGYSDGRSLINQFPTSFETGAISPLILFLAYMVRKEISQENLRTNRFLELRKLDPVIKECHPGITHFESSSVHKSSFVGEVPSVQALARGIVSGECDYWVKYLKAYTSRKTSVGVALKRNREATRVWNKILKLKPIRLSESRASLYESTLFLKNSQRTYLQELQTRIISTAIGVRVSRP